MRLARELKAAKNATIKRSMHVRDVETRSTRPQIVPTLIKRAENVERTVIWQVRGSAGSQQPKPKGHGKQSKGGKGTSSPKWTPVVTMPEEKVHAVDESAATVSVVKADFGQSNFGQSIFGHRVWPANFGQSIFGQN